VKKKMQGSLTMFGTPIRKHGIKCGNEIPHGSIVIGSPNSYGRGTRQLAQGGHVDAVKWLA
jgi:hypothetical protein